MQLPLLLRVASGFARVCAVVFARVAATGLAVGLVVALDIAHALDLALGRALGIAVYVSALVHVPVWSCSLLLLRLRDLVFVRFPLRLRLHVRTHALVLFRMLTAQILLPRLRCLVLLPLLVLVMPRLPCLSSRTPALASPLVLSLALVMPPARALALHLALARPRAIARDPGLAVVRAAKGK